MIANGYNTKTLEFEVTGKKVPNEIKLIKETATSDSTIELDEAKMVRIVVASYGKTYLGCTSRNRSKWNINSKKSKTSKLI